MIVHRFKVWFFAALETTTNQGGFFLEKTWKSDSEIADCFKRAWKKIINSFAQSQFYVKQKKSFVTNNTGRTSQNKNRTAPVLLQLNFETHIEK